MPYFRKKPAVIEAEQFDGTQRTIDRLVRLGAALPNYNKSGAFLGTMRVETREGVVLVRPGDWLVVVGVEGKVYPCRDDIFRATYEPVDGAVPDSREE